MTKEATLEAVNSALSREVRVLQEQLKQAGKLGARLLIIVRLAAEMRQLQKVSAASVQLDTDVQSNLKRAEDDFDAQIGAILADMEVVND